MSNIVVVISSVIVALATVVIAFVSKSNLNLAKSLQNKSDQHEQVMKYLLNALVIALLSAPHGNDPQSAGVMRFKQQYKGKTPILHDE